MFPLQFVVMCLKDSTLRLIRFSQKMFEIYPHCMLLNIKHDGISNSKCDVKQLHVSADTAANISNEVTTSNKSEHKIISSFENLIWLQNNKF